MGKRKNAAMEPQQDFAKWVEWTDIGPSAKSQEMRIWNLRLQIGGTYQVRLVGKSIRCFKYFIAGKSAITADPAMCPIAKKYNIEPITRYAVNLIDRADGRIKITEGPPSMFLPFQHYLERTGVDPGRPDACDFVISVTKPGKNIIFTVESLPNASPFTADEQSLIANGVHDLPRIYQATPRDQIEQKLGLRWP